MRLYKNIYNAYHLVNDTLTEWRCIYYLMPNKSSIGYDIFQDDHWSLIGFDFGKISSKNVKYKDLPEGAKNNLTNLEYIQVFGENNDKVISK